MQSEKGAPPKKQNLYSLLLSQVQLAIARSSAKEQLLAPGLCLAVALASKVW